jgi:hypothetical protein
LLRCGESWKEYNLPITSAVQIAPGDVALVVNVEMCLEAGAWRCRECCWTSAGNFHRNWEICTLAAAHDLFIYTHTSTSIGASPSACSSPFRALCI